MINDLDQDLIAEIRAILEPFQFMMPSFRVVIRECDAQPPNIRRVIGAVNNLLADPLLRSASLRADILMWGDKVNQRPAAQAELTRKAEAA